MKDTRYLYAVSRVKALENNLLTRNTVERMLEATTPESALKILSETEYGNHFAEVDSVYDFEKALEAGLKSTYKVIDDSTRDHRFTLLSKLRYDFHNLKVLLKQKYLEQDYEYILSSLGSTEVETLKKAVADDEYAHLPYWMKTACEEAVVDFQLNKDPQRIDIIFDRALYASLIGLAEDIGDDSLKDMVKTEIDLININSFLRVKKMDKGARFLETVLLEGGFLNSSFFLDAVNEPVNSFLDRLSSTRYDRIAMEGVQSWIDTGKSTVLEKVADNFQLNLARAGKYAAFGILPIVGFLKAVENEAKLIRMVMVGKINGISADTMRERLRDVYV